MNINSATLRNIDTRHSYYLDNNGQIVRGGFGHWLKCLFNIGDARQRVAALAEKVKAALLKDGEIEQEATLDNEIGRLDGKCLNVTYAISGAQLRAIANRFCAAHTVAVGRSDARRLAEACAETAVQWALSENMIMNDAGNVQFLKRICVYAVNNLIEDKTSYANAPATGSGSLEEAMQKTIKRVILRYPTSSSLLTQAKRGLPTINPDGNRSWLGANIKFDEFYFRLYVAMTVDVNEDGTVCKQSANDLGGLLTLENSVVSRARGEILALKLPPAGEPGGLAKFAADVRKIIGNHKLYNEAARDSLNPFHASADGPLPPVAVYRLKRCVLDKMYALYGKSVVESFQGFRQMLEGRPEYVDALNKFVDDANQAGKKLSEDDVALQNLEKAVTDVCRYNCALKSLADKISTITYKAKGSVETMQQASAFAASHPDIFEKLWHAKGLADVNETMDGATDAIKAHLAFTKEVEGLKKSALADAKARFAEESGIPADVLAKLDVCYKSIEMALDEAAQKIIRGEEQLPEDKAEATNAIKARFKGLVDEFIAARANLVKEINGLKDVNEAVRSYWIRAVATFKNLQRMMKPAAFASAIAAIKGECEKIVSPGSTRATRKESLGKIHNVLTAKMKEAFGEKEWEDCGSDERGAAMALTTYGALLVVKGGLDYFKDNRADFQAIATEFQAESSPDTKADDKVKATATGGYNLIKDIYDEIDAADVWNP